MDEIVNNHLDSLKTLFLSLSHGVLPVCQPQRERITESQRELVEQLQTSTRNTAKRLMRSKRAEMVDLFTIIKDSLKMARNAYNTFGLRNL